MKRLKLTAIQLGGSEILDRHQLKNVLGGNANLVTTVSSTKKKPCGTCTYLGNTLNCSGTVGNCTGCGGDCGIA